MAQMCIYLKNKSNNQIFTVQSLVLSNEKKCQRDMEVKYQGKTLQYIGYLFFPRMVEAYRLELLNPACVHAVYRTVLPASGGETTHFVAPVLFISNICSSVH